MTDMPPACSVCDEEDGPMTLLDGAWICMTCLSLEVTSQRALLGMATVFESGDASAIRRPDGMWVVYVEDHGTLLVGEHATPEAAMSALDAWRAQREGK